MHVYKCLSVDWLTNCMSIVFVTCGLQALVQPLKFLAGTRRVWRCVLVSWLLAAIVAVPQLIVFIHTERLVTSPDTKQTLIIYKCENKGYSDEWQRKVYFSLIIVILFIVPACIMLFCYVSIIRVVWLRIKVVYIVKVYHETSSVYKFDFLFRFKFYKTVPNITAAMV